MPVIFTKPPSGSQPTPYSVSPRCQRSFVRPKNSEKRSTRIPTALAAVKCPSSCRMISAAKPAKARNQLTRAPPGPRARRRSGAPRRRPRRATRTSARLRAGSCSSVPSITAGMPMKPSRSPRNAWTATSLAALSTHGAVPPARAAAKREAERRERLEVRRLEGQRAHLRRGRAPAPARRRARGGAARRRSARACRGGRGARARRRRTAGPSRGRSTAGARRRRCGRRACRTGGAPRSPRGPCSSASPSRS